MASCSGASLRTGLAPILLPGMAVVDILLNKGGAGISPVPVPTLSGTLAGDDTSPCDRGEDESKPVSALQGAICG